MTAFCTACKKEKTLDDFSKAAGKSSVNRPVGRKSHCKDCVRRKTKAYYASPNGRKYRQEKSWRDNGISDMTVEIYDQMLADQNGKCAICGADENKNGTRLCVDHDHSTGATRGLLCHNCNITLGRSNDDPAQLRRAAEYLEFYMLKAVV